MNDVFVVLVHHQKIRHWSPRLESTSETGSSGEVLHSIHLSFCPLGHESDSSLCSVQPESSNLWREKLSVCLFETAKQMQTEMHCDWSLTALSGRTHTHHVGIGSVLKETGGELGRVEVPQQVLNDFKVSTPRQELTENRRCDDCRGLSADLCEKDRNHEMTVS